MKLHTTVRFGVCFRRTAIVLFANHSQRRCRLAAGSGTKAVDGLVEKYFEAVRANQSESDINKDCSRAPRTRNVQELK